MGEFSLPHLLILLVIVLVIFGPSKLPGLGKGLGEAIRGFKKGLNDDSPDSSRQVNQAPQNSHGTLNQGSDAGHSGSPSPTNVSSKTDDKIKS